MEKTSTISLSEQIKNKLFNQVKKTKSQIENLKDTEISIDRFSSIFFNKFPDRNKNTIQMYLGYAFEEIMRQLFWDKCGERIVYHVDLKHKPIDILVEQYAINAKYRFGTTNGAHLDVFKNDVEEIKKLGLVPLMLIYRADNYKPLLDKAKEMGWIVLEGEDTKRFIKSKTGIDIDILFDSIKYSF